MENLLATPATALEIMLGKILPYIVVGAVQVTVVLTLARVAVPGADGRHLLMLSFGACWFHRWRLLLGFTFSTLARNQLQAMQMTFFFFLPSILLSGFMFPFRGMPEWAQVVGEIFPLTHFLRVVRAAMLKGASLDQVGFELSILGLFVLIYAFLALTRFRRTLD